MAITVMTYNVGNGLAEPARFARFLRELDADVVGLQELAAGQAHSLQRQLADQYPYQVLWPTGFAGRGLLSRYPILQEEPLPLYPERPDLQAVIDAEGLLLGVVVAHPPPPRLVRGRVRFDSAALSQLDALADTALRHAPSVMLGDFNMTARNPVYGRYVAAGLVDAFAEAGVGRGWTLPRRLGQTSRFNHGLHGLRLQPVARVDYIWYTAALCAEAAWVAGDGGSDHLPVLARLIQR